MAETPETFKPVDPKVLELVNKVVKDIEDGSYRRRHPERGKMFNCPVCGRRHDGKQCEQRFAVRYIEEDVETGERTTVFATSWPQGKRPTLKQFFGAQSFKGKRRNPHHSRTKLMFIERVREVMKDVDRNSEQFQEMLDQARKFVGQEIRGKESRRSNRRRQQQDLSRRINNGLATPGTQLNNGLPRFA